jgi:predicted O-methyltransferase YrrM
MPTGASEEPLPPGASELDVYAQALDDSECVLVAQQYIGAGALRAALELCRSRGATASRSRGLVLCEARARFGLGERDAALLLLDGLLASQPCDVLASFYKAQLLAQAGQSETAKQVLTDVIRTTPDFPGALPALAQLSFPGPSYREVLRFLHERLRPRCYLEIGVEHGSTLQLAVHSEVVLGVDPVPRDIPHRLPAATRLFHMTSDAFFATHSPSSLLAERRIDLAFIDGMHWFEFVLRDFHNVERWCHPGSMVVLHDCLPVAEVAASRDRQTSFWVGDSWKALDGLLKHRPELHVSVIPCYPSGLVIIQDLDPQSETLPQCAGALREEYLEKRYPHAQRDWPNRYRIIENTERGLNQLVHSGTALPLVDPERLDV